MNRKTKYLQSVQFDSQVEQQYYDHLRSLMIDHRINSLPEILKQIEDIPDSQLKVERERFFEIVALVFNDYMSYGENLEDRVFNY